MCGVAVACHLGDDAFVFPWAVDVVAHCIGYFLRPLGCIGEIVDAVALMHPRCLGEILEVELVDFSVDLRHVGFQLGVIGVLVAPEYIRLSVGVDEDGWVDAYPAVGGSGAVVLGE